MDRPHLKFYAPGVPHSIDYPNTYYNGPLFDSHIHIQSIPDGGPGSENEEIDFLLLGVNTSIPHFVCTLRYDQTYRALAFFPVWEPIVDPQLEIVSRTLEQYPGLFVPFIMPPADDGSPNGFPTVNAAELDRMLSIRPGLFKGYGEIGLYARNEGAPELPPNHPRLKAIYPIVRKHGLVVYFHLGEDQQEEYEEILSENPDISFIFHGDQLITQRQDGTQDLRAIDEILSHHPNVTYEVDELWGDVWLLKPGAEKEDFLAHFRNYEPLLEKDLETWKALIEKHPNQVIWGSDRGVSTLWDLDHEVALQLHDYVRAFIGKLSPAVQERYAYKNSERLFGINTAQGNSTGS